MLTGRFREGRRNNPRNVRLIHILLLIISFQAFGEAAELFLRRSVRCRYANPPVKNVLIFCTTFHHLSTRWKKKIMSRHSTNHFIAPVFCLLLPTHIDPPKEPYLLIDQRRLDAGNMFIPVKENSELTLACVSEGGNPKPSLSWEVLLSPGIDRHAQKISNDVLELQEIKRDKVCTSIYIPTICMHEKLYGIFRDQQDWSGMNDG